MKRKAIQLAGKTIVISLPSKWVKKFNINKGDELDLEEQGNKIIINTGKLSEEETLEVNVSKLDKILNRFIGALYKSGYDEVKIIFDNHKQLETIYEVLNKTCIGYEVIRHEKNHLVIKQVSKIQPEEFDNILRRLFLFLVSISNDSYEAIKKQDKNLLKNLILRDANVNKYADFCRRAIIKEAVHKERLPALYYIIESLERLGDNYRDLNKFILENKIRLSKETFKLFDEINDLLELFYSIFYKFSLERMEEFVSHKEKISKTLDKSIVETKGDELRVLFYLENIFNLLFDMNGTLMVFKFK